MTAPALYVTPLGRVVRHQRRAGVIAMWERMARVSLRDPMPATDRRGR